MKTNTTHVLIVSAKTFKYHLEYLFIGTGAKNYVLDFNDSDATTLSPSAERLLINMIGDCSRIRKGDKIIFYLQQIAGNHSKEPLQGKFFGVFQAKQNWGFLDNNNDNQFLKNELEKSLTFRTLIEPLDVYSKGVTEWEALDSLANVISPHQLVWSLIYRKLRGNRGNTMITLYESEKIIQLLREKNERKKFDGQKVLSFDMKNHIIIELPEEQKRKYIGNINEEIKIFKRLKFKVDKKIAFESHLQAYLIKYLGLNKSNIDQEILGNNKINWLGNEVGCGVGMQSIDILIDTTSEHNRIDLIPIELKVTDPPLYITNQFQRYIDWISQYYKPNRQCDISPIIIWPKQKTNGFNKKKKLDTVIKKINEFNLKNKNICNKIKILEFVVSDDEVILKKLDY